MSALGSEKLPRSLSSLERANRNYVSSHKNSRQRCVSLPFLNWWLNQGHEILHEPAMLVSGLQIESFVWVFINCIGFAPTLHKSSLAAVFPQQSKKRNCCVILCVFASCQALYTGWFFHRRKSVNIFHTPDAAGNILLPSPNKPKRHASLLRWVIIPTVLFCHSMLHVSTAP